MKALEVVPTEPTQLGAEMLNRHLSPYQPGRWLYTPDAERAVGGTEKGHAGRRQEIPR